MKTLNSLLSLITALLISTSVFAQVKQIRNVSDFSKINVSEGIQVTLTMGNFEKVEVNAPEDYIDKIVTKTEGSTLKLYIEGNNNNGYKKKIEVFVTAIQMNGIKASSGSSVTTTNLIKSESFEVSVSSGAHANIEIEAHTIEAESSSGSSMVIRGTTTNLEADASSGASLLANKLVAQKADADVSSGAHIRLFVENDLEAEASSGGSIFYSGKPKKIDIEKSSGGSVSPN